MVFHNDAYEEANRRRRRRIPWLIGLALVAALIVWMVYGESSSPPMPADTNAGRSVKTAPPTPVPPTP